MPLKRGFTVLSILFLALCWSGATHAQVPGYLLTGGSAGEQQIGTGLPLPVGPAGIFLGGMTPTNGGTSCGGGPGGCAQSPDGPGTAYWPPLLVVPNPAASTGGTPTKAIWQDGATGQGGGIWLETAVLSVPAPGTPAPIAVFPTNPAVFQVATTISYAWPGGKPALLAPGRAPGPAVLGTALAGGVIAYSGGAKSFGGPGQFAITAGPGAAGGRVPPNAVSAQPVASVWINAFAGLPQTVTKVGVVGASNPVGLAQPGASVANPVGTTMFGALVSSGIGVVNGSQITSLASPPGPIPCPPACPVGPAGTITQSLILPVAFPSNMVTGSKGFPWTTGLITISQPGAAPAEIFWLSGTDNRVAGAGNISLVSGSLSVRALSGPNANRGWLSLSFVQTPEPAVMLGATGALAMLGICHGLVRRRSR